MTTALVGTPAMLIRVSSRNQELAPQQAEIERWAANQNPPLVIGRVYREGAVSGFAEKRTALDLLIQDGKNGLVSMVIVTEVSRISRRGIVDSLQKLQALWEAGVRVVILHGLAGFNDLNPHKAAATPREQLEREFQMLMISVLALIGKQEALCRRERTKAALQDRKRAGKRIGKPGLQWTDEHDRDLIAWYAGRVPLEEMSSRISDMRDTYGRIFTPPGGRRLRGHPGPTAVKARIAYLKHAGLIALRPEPSGGYYVSPWFRKPRAPAAMLRAAKRQGTDIDEVDRKWREDAGLPPWTAPEKPAHRFGRTHGGKVEIRPDAGNRGSPVEVRHK